MSDTRDPAPRDPAASQPARRKSGASRLIALVLVVVAAGGGYWYFTKMRSDTPAPPQAAAPAGAPPVTVATPLQKELVEWDEFTGQFAPVDFVEVRARVSGYLQSINFTDGQMVKKGDLLFVIDPRPFEIAAASARAQLAQASARVDLAQRQLSRAGQLRDRDFVSGSSYDERVQEMRVASGAVEIARADVRSAELNLEFTRITAPVTGRISRHEVSLGNLVSGGEGGATTLLTTIVSLDPIHFVFDMSESDLIAYQRAVAEGKMRSARDGSVIAQVRLFDEKDWPREGIIDFVDNQVDRGAGTIRVRARFANPNNFITAGQFGRLRLPGSEPYQALLVPDSALVTDQSRKVVMVVKDDNTIEPRIVRPGPTELGLRIIRSGLNPGERIVINGLLRVRPGMKVTPQPGKIEPDPKAS